MRRKPDERAELCLEFHDALITALRYAAYRCGYALAVHGSLKRDIDLVACPWRVGAISPEGLVKELVVVVKAVIGIARFKKHDQNPFFKPCGRLAWAVYLTHDDAGPYLDISVMPRGAEPKPDDHRAGNTKKGRR